MKNDKGKNIIIALLVVIIIILVALVVLFATNTISFNSKTSNSENQLGETSENTNNEIDNKSQIIEVTLPSGNSISVNEEYKNIFNDNEKIIITTGNLPSEDSNTSNSELTLSELLEKRLDEYNDDIYTGKKVSISNTSFDFDNDGINEIMFSFCEEFILLHYYDGKVYGYVLGGYRTNNNWRINGVSTHSGSALVGGYTKYSFDGNKLTSEDIASTEVDYSNQTSTDVDVIYKLNGKVVDKTDFDNFVEEIRNVALIEYVDYSKN